MQQVPAPPFRCETGAAIDTLAVALGLRNELHRQDWPYEVADGHYIDQYLSHYHTLTDADERFTLMVVIVQATNDQPKTGLFIHYWGIIRQLLQHDFALHQYTVWYWSCFDNEYLSDCFRLAPYMRELWHSQLKTSNL